MAVSVPIGRLIRRNSRKLWLWCELITDKELSTGMDFDLDSELLVLWKMEACWSTSLVKMERQNSNMRNFSSLWEICMMKYVPPPHIFNISGYNWVMTVQEWFIWVVCIWVYPICYCFMQPFENLLFLFSDLFFFSLFLFNFPWIILSLPFMPL